MAENLTIYQRLTQMFGSGRPTIASSDRYPQFKLGSKDILKTDSKKDFEENLKEILPRYELAEEYEMCQKIKDSLDYLNKRK